MTFCKILFTEIGTSVAGTILAYIFTMSLSYSIINVDNKSYSYSNRMDCPTIRRLHTLVSDTADVILSLFLIKGIQEFLKFFLILLCKFEITLKHKGKKGEKRRRKGRKNERRKKGCKEGRERELEGGERLAMALR